MTTSAPIVVDLDAWFANTLGGAGNGKSNRMGVGMGVSAWSWQNRLAMRFPRPDALFASIPAADQISSFPIYMRASNDLFGIGANVKFYLERATGTFTEYQVKSSEGNPDTFVSTSGPASGEWPGPSTVTTDRAEYEGSPSDKDWIAVEARDLARWWWAQAAGTPLIVVAKASDGAGGYAESTTGRRGTFYTRESTSAPYGQVVYTTDLPPNAPSDLSPADGATVPSATSTTAAVTFRHTTPGGLAASKYQAQWWPSAATDDENGNVSGATVTKDQTVTAAIASGALKTHTFTGLPTRTAGKWRARTYAASQWGPWSRLRSATTAYQPSVVNPSTTPGTTTPDFLDSLVSGDASDYATAYQDVVYQDTPSGTITKSDTGKQTYGGATSRVTRTYSGSALAYGTPYRRRRRLWNRDDVPTTPDASWPQAATDVPFTQYEPVGGQARIGADDGPLWNTSTLIATLTPALFASDPNGSDIDQAQIRLKSESGTTIYTSPVVEEAAGPDIEIDVPSGVLTPGMNPTLEVAVRISGNADIGPFSTPVAGHVNSTPGAPFPVTVTGAVQNSAGVWVTTDSTPEIVAVYRDADVDLGYTDPPSRQEVVILDDNGDPFASSPYVDDTDPAETFTSPTLTEGEVYSFSVRYDDDAAFRSLFSTPIFVKYLSAPTLSDVTPADEATITDPTPTFAWTFSRTVAAWQLVISAGETELVNTGLVAGADAEYTLDPGLLPNATELTWTLTVYDADGLSDSVTRTFTSDFSVPAAITGLALTVDEEALGLLATWDQTALDPEEFVSYVLEASINGGAFRRIATITDPDITAYLFIGAGHNVETIIRISQSNGYASSPTVQASETLTASGYWLKTPGDITPLPTASTPSPGRTDHGQGDTQTDLEVLDPPGRGEKLVLDWGTTGYEATVDLFTKDRDLIRLLRRYKEEDTVAIFATPYGAVRYVRLTSTPDDDQPGYWITGGFSYIEVAPDPDRYGY